MNEIGLDSHSFGIPTFDNEGAEVSGPMSAYCVPAMMGRKFIGDASSKIVCLSDIFRIPQPIGRRAEDINAGEFKVFRPDRMKPETV
jgi:hypothetical protein